MNPIMRIAAELIAGIAVLVLTIAWLEHRGAQSCIARDTTAANGQAVDTARKEGEAAGRAAAIKEAYEQKVAERVMPVAPIRLCPAAVAPRAREVLPAAADRPGPARAAQVRAADPSVPTDEWDPTPVVQLGNECDARIIALQDSLKSSYGGNK